MPGSGAQKKMTSSDRANLLEKGAEPRPPTPSKKPTITTKKLALSISGVFVLYVLHDALQERAFRQPGFRFGWFMTLIEIVVVSACAFAFEWGAPPDPTVVSEGAMRTIRALDSVSFQTWFVSHGGSLESIRRMWNPIAYALGFIDCEAISARCMLTIFMMFASKTEASKLNLLKGSPHRWLTGPILDYIQERGATLHLRHRVKEVHYEEGQTPKVTSLTLSTPEGERNVQADVYLAACDVPGIQRLLPDAWRKHEQFDAIHRLEAVPVATVQLRYDGWVTELAQGDVADARRTDLSNPTGLNNLLYTADADFSCFADLALASPEDYRKPGEGSLLQCVLTPGDPWIPKSVSDIVAHTDAQVRKLFPSAQHLNLTWSNVVKLAQSLYREAPGMEPYRPDQRTPVSNFFLAGSYTRQDYIDSMEGATMSGHLAAAAILGTSAKLATNAAVA